MATKKNVHNYSKNCYAFFPPIDNFLLIVPCGDLTERCLGEYNCKGTRANKKMVQDEKAKDGGEGRSYTEVSAYRQVLLQ